AGDGDQGGGPGQGLGAVALPAEVVIQPQTPLAQGRPRAEALRLLTQDLGIVLEGGGHEGLPYSGGTITTSRCALSPSSPVLSSPTEEEEPPAAQARKNG